MNGLGDTALLTLDAGNTYVRAGVFVGGDRVGLVRIAHRDTPDWAAALEAGLTPWKGWRGAAVASVAPSLDGVLARVCRTVTGHAPLVVDHRTDLGIRVAIGHPEQVGADRLANAAGAYLAWGGPVVVVDVGTAITLCVVDGVGDYLGGAIAPGPGLALDALVSGTEKLPAIDWESAPMGPIGATTEAAMGVGITLGFAGLVDRLIAGAIHGLKARGPVPVVVTGGLGARLSPHLGHPHHYREEWTLTGLHRVFERIHGVSLPGR